MARNDKERAIVKIFFASSLFFAKDIRYMTGTEIKATPSIGISGATKGVMIA